MQQDNEIVFEDLHGLNEDKPVTIDLDAGNKDTGISESPDDQSAGDDAGNDDDIQIDELRSADLNDDAEPEPDNKDAASKPSGDDDYSKKVKARIQRATRGEKRAKQESEYWKRQAESLHKQSTERGMEAAKKIIEQADSAIENTQAQLKTAIEDGKTDDQVRLTSQLTDQKAEKIQAEFSLTDLSESGNLEPFDGKVVTPTPKGEKEADRWVEERSDWYGAKGFERQTRLANRLDKEVMSDGYDPDTPEYFEELDNRIKAKEPKLYDAADDADTPPPDEGSERPRRTPVAPVDGARNRRQRSNSSKVELGETDFANMRRFGLDPNDPKVLREYAANKREAEAGEQS
jgi:hypothetical protein